MQNKRFRFGPIALTATLTTNILNPATATGGTNGGSSSQYIVLQTIRLINKTGAPGTVTLYLGATGANTAGTELCLAKVVPANDVVVLQGPFRLDAADFLVGGANAATTITIQGDGEVGVAG